MNELSAILGLGVAPKDLGFAHLLARSGVVFVYVLVLLRVAKRRFLAQRDPLDILLFFLLASMMSRAINGSAAFFPTLAGALFMVLLHRALTRICFAWPAFSHFLKGISEDLVQDGVLHERALAHHALSADDLAEDLRAAGVSDLARVGRARFERNGSVSVEKKPVVVEHDLGGDGRTLRIEVAP